MSVYDRSQSGNTVEHCLVVVPTFNEAGNIIRLIDEVLAQSPVFDILVVDDNSPDGTGTLVAELAADNPRIHLLQREGKLGLGTAYIAGFAYGLKAGYAYLAQMDADFSHQPCYLPRLLNLVQYEADVAIGSRNIKGGRVENWSLLRKFVSRGGSFYARLILGLPIRDCTGGFKCFRAAALRQIDLSSIRSNGYAFQVEMNYRCHQANLAIKETPIVFPDREVGQSKMSSQIVKEAAWMVLKLRFTSTPAHKSAPAVASQSR